MHRATCWAVVAAMLGLLWAVGSSQGEEPGATEEAQAWGMELRTYDVRELCAERCDFPAPELGLGDCRSGFSPWPGYTWNHSKSAENLAELVKLRISPESWGPGKGEVQDRAGRLVVIQTAENHARIMALLEDLSADLCHRIMVEGLVLAVDARIADGLRRRRSPQFSAAEVDELVRAAGKDGLIARPQVLCANQQRNHGAGLRSAPYLRSYRLADGTLVPEPADAEVGTVFEVLPILSTDRSAADIELCFTMVSGWQERKADFSTLCVPDRRPAAPPVQGEAKGAREPINAAAPRLFHGRLCLPSVSTWSLRNSVTVPLGKYVLAGRGPEAPGQAAGGKAAPARTVVVLVRASLAAGRAGLAPLANEPGQPKDAMALRVYDVADLVIPVRQSYGPLLGMQPDRRRLARGAVVDDFRGPPVAQPLPPGALMDMIKKVIEPATWGVNGAAIEEKDATLIAMHTPAVHERIARFIIAQRAEHKRQLAVQCLALILDQKTAARLVQRESGKLSVEEVKALVGKAGPAGLLADCGVLCFSTQNVSISGIRTISFVREFIGDGSVLLPASELARTGWVLDTRPVLSVEQRSVDLDMRFSWGGQWEEKAEEPVATVFNDPGGKGAPAKLPWRAPGVKCWTVQGSPRAPLGSYVLAGSFQRELAEPGGRRPSATETVVVLVKADIVGGLPALSNPAAEAMRLSQAEVDRIRALIRQLGDRSFETREGACRELAATGLKAMPFLEAAAQSADLEVAERATRTIAQIWQSGRCVQGR